MTYKEVSTMVKSIGLPYAYYQFPEGTAEAPPFICFFWSEDNDLKADNINYQKIERLNIELYTDNKDYENEANIETVLTNNSVVWSKSETYIDSERLYMVLYEADVIVTQERN